MVLNVVRGINDAQYTYCLANRCDWAIRHSFVELALHSFPVEPNFFGLAKFDDGRGSRIVKFLGEPDRCFVKSRTWRGGALIVKAETGKRGMKIALAYLEDHCGRIKTLVECSYFLI